MDCQQYANQCPAPPPAPPLTHVPFTSTALPYTGASFALFVGVALALVAAGLVIRYSGRAR